MHVKLFYKYNYFCVICINTVYFSLEFFLDSEDVFKQHTSMVFHVSGVQFGARRPFIRKIEIYLISKNQCYNIGLL